MATDYRYTGQKLDSSVGLYLMGARWYDSSLSRWLSPDTIVPDPGDPQSLNRYMFVLGNPLKFTDPSGHFTEDEIMQYFGVDTWDRVLAIFDPYSWADQFDILPEWRALAGNSGFLQVLRDSSIGDTVEFWAHIIDPKDPGAVITGAKIAERKFEVCGARICQMSGLDILLPETDWMVRTNTRFHPSYEYETRVMYGHSEFDGSNVDWIDVGVNVVGIAGDLANVVPAYGQIAWLASEGVELWNVGRLAHSDDPLTVALGGAFWGGGKLAPPPYGTLISFVSMAYDLAQGAAWEP